MEGDYNLLLNRLYCNNKDTLGIMFYLNSINSLRYCFTLEDEFRNKKIYGETRIDAGQYQIKLRTIGRTYERYCNHKNLIIKKFTQQYGILELQDVPKFKYILIHIGNDEDDTDGCIVVGNETKNNSIQQGWISNSTIAYMNLILSTSKAFDANKNVYITINDMDRRILKQYNLL